MCQAELGCIGGFQTRAWQHWDAEMHWDELFACWDAEMQWQAIWDCARGCYLSSTKGECMLHVFVVWSHNNLCGVIKTWAHFCMHVCQPCCTTRGVKLEQSCSGAFFIGRRSGTPKS